ncbi:MAG: acyltransferase [Lachnospiraceae bacterium]|nr:acyltransferase [Lachnospiraceae bacterium]
MKTAVQNRISWIRGILCILVVYVHCQNTDWFNTASVPWIASAERGAASLFTAIAVPGFFFLSGYLFFRNFTPDQLGRKLKSRIFTLLIPFILWNLIYYFIELALRNLPLTAGLFDGSEVPFTVKEILLAAFNYKYNPVFWFMQFLIVYTALSPLIWLLMKNRISGIAVLALVFGAVFLLSLLSPSGFWRVPYEMLQFFPAYLGGCFSAIHLRKLFEEKKPSVLISAVSALLLAGLHAWNLCAPSLLSEEMVRLLTGPLLWFALSPIPFGKPMAWMRFTFFFYAAHHLMAHLINKMASVVLGTHMAIGGVFFLVLPWVIVPVLFGIGLLFERFLPPVAKLLGIGKPVNRKKAAV